MELADRVPASMVVLGAGAVGSEFASIYASFGSQVTLVVNWILKTAKQCIYKIGMIAVKSAVVGRSNFVVV